MIQMTSPIIVISTGRVNSCVGAEIIGLNCNFDYTVSLKTMEMMKEALDRWDLRPYLMMQPLGFLCPETENLQEGYVELPECPFGWFIYYTSMAQLSVKRYIIISSSLYQPF